MEESKMEKTIQKTKHYRAGFKKTTSKSHTVNVNLTKQDSVLQLNIPETTKLNQIEIKLSLINEYVQSGQLKYLAAVLNTMEHIDKTLLKCLDIRIKTSYEHVIDITTKFNLAIINVHVDIKYKCKDNGLAYLYEFLHRGRLAILNHDYCSPTFFLELVRILTDMAIDIDG